jgi:hypothetical protein
MQVNARKIYDEPDVLDGILQNRLFLGILGTEAALQVVSFGAVLHLLMQPQLHLRQAF